ncbi:hypothetical protein ACFYVL_09355 [Streptomyces sp. NPDC004111]|uniref:hypothetical protein n=1 Tax=Streptomyces sp. NPDC004111 TaxID=3364690 RepID=UPI003681D6B5
MADPHITLAYSRDRGIVAVVSGENYAWARTALTESGFEQGEAGVYHLSGHDPDASPAMVSRALVSCAARHRTSVSTSSRPFLMDAARDLIALLPGTWSADIEVYSHPSGQEDLVSYVWDSGELGRAVQTERLPYAAILTHRDAGIDLLLVERPGHPSGYCVGAFAPADLETGYDDPHAPRSAVLPASPDQGARIITERFLPAYEQAVHHRRSAAVSEALDRISGEHDAWKAMALSGRYSDGTVLGANTFSALTEEFLSTSWRNFRTVAEHAAPVLERCDPGRGPWPQDAPVLSALSHALDDAHLLHNETGWDLVRSGDRARAWPAISTWLDGRAAFHRQARTSPLHKRPALALTAAPHTPVVRPALRR